MMHLFHSWGIWVTEERERKAEVFTAATALTPATSFTDTRTEFFQFRECIKCGKRKTIKL